MWLIALNEGEMRSFLSSGQTSRAVAAAPSFQAWLRACICTCCMCVCMYVYLCMCTDMYVCMYMHVYVCVYTYACTYTCHKYMYVYAYLCIDEESQCFSVLVGVVDAHVFVCACICVCICMYVCVYMFIFLQWMLHAFWNRCPGHQCTCRCVLYKGVFWHQRTHMWTHSLQGVHMCVYAYICVYACICIWMRMCVYYIASCLEASLVRFSICV